MVDIHYRPLPQGRRAERGLSIAWKTALHSAGGESAVQDYDPDDRSTRVYFVRRSDGLIKIGFSNNIAKRKKELQTGAGPLTTLLTLPGDWALEQALHRKFQMSHAYNEWFNPTPDLLEYIEQQRSEQEQ